MCQDRERDINLCLGVGEQDEELTYYEILSTGLSTLDKDITQGHQANGFKVVEKKIKLETLTEICDKYVNGDINFLKIDVEGAEAAVIRGMNFNKYRPWYYAWRQHYQAHRLLAVNGKSCFWLMIISLCTLTA